MLFGDYTQTVVGELSCSTEGAWGVPVGAFAPHHFPPEGKMTKYHAFLESPPPMNFDPLIPPQKISGAAMEGGRGLVWVRYKGDS